ncbi:hypothetical protein TraAM80_03146 [Trypanosoma rangeli]|uniref:Uncharacterized protein n=1 Tax=Trypanosoma rangeli TaxID=5698 RepID=A0A3R7L510_TRYRA|nr:uncharacterized protein TraAM80_03146 [Trypanosoma rangeli]RNF07772.1 hypothetical protein TraAM80_03146 [Trypanosoma rangeli]|eukprot:RNF07772.1 hypothetical protein TraAM80_03146 [Trypanosoma rangeli]
MSEIIFVEPCVLCTPRAVVETHVEGPCAAEGGFIASSPASHYTHVALYEWIQKFAERDLEKRLNANSRLQDLEEIEAALREMIALDESQIHTNHIVRCHLAFLQRQQQRRERELTMRETLLKYQLHRLLHLERCFNAARGDKSLDAMGTLQHAEKLLKEEMQKFLVEMYTPELSRAQEAQRFAEDRLQASVRVVEHQTARLESIKRELNEVCLFLNDLAACAKVAARCDDSRGRSAYAAFRREENAFCTPQKVILAVQERIRELELRQASMVQDVNPAGTSNDTFDALTLAVCRLEETRAEFYAFNRQAPSCDLQIANDTVNRSSSSSSSNCVKPPLPPPSASSFPPPMSSNAGPKESFMESRTSEIHHAVLHEQRRLIMMLNCTCGVRPVLLRLSTESEAERYARRPLSLFAGHSLSLHQWTHTDGTRTVKRAAVFYPTSPKRDGEVPKENLESLLFAKAKEKGDLFEIIDLRAEVKDADVYFMGDAVAFSADGNFMYLCCGAADTFSDARRTATVHVAELLRRRLGVPSANCFCYYSSFSSVVSLGWAGAGVCAWALDEMCFPSREEKESFDLHLRETYCTVIHLTRAEVENFANECVEIVSHMPRDESPKRRLVISSHALRSLSERHRATLTAWYGDGGCIVPDLPTIERMRGHSVRSMMLTVVTHGSHLPPPSLRGFFSFLGIRANERARESERVSE